jgi:hypothetical protein
MEQILKKVNANDNISLVYILSTCVDGKISKYHITQQDANNEVSIELPIDHVSTIKELLGRKCSGSGLESREYGRRDPPH